MNLSKFDKPLNDYVASLSLTATQDQRITSALEKVLGLVLSKYSEADVYAQGSYSTDTMVKPLTSVQSGGKPGQYDIDIAIERNTWDDPVEALEEIAELIESDGTYGQMEIDKTKNSCVRIAYSPDGSGIGFHIDLVPTKLTGIDRFAPNREDAAWKPSDTKKFTDWFNGLANEHPEMRHISLIIKRLRDRADMNDNLKSIMILTLVAGSYQPNDSLMGDLLAVLDNIQARFADESQAPRIANPVNTGEDLSLTIDDYSKLRAFFRDLSTELKAAISEDDADSLKGIFGDGFAYTAEEKVAHTTLAAEPVKPVRAYGVGSDTTQRQ